MDLNSNDDLLQFKQRVFDLIEEPRRLLPPIQGFEKMDLVPLEVAVALLAQHIPNITEAAKTAKEHCKLLPANELTIDESASIFLYTMELKQKGQSLYTILNKTLRDENRDRLKHWFPYLKLIISSLLKIPSTSCRLFRGVKQDLSQDYPKGQTTVWWAFSSCADSLEVLQKPTFLGKTGTRTLFEIDCHSGRDIRRYSRYQIENEVLLLPARQFQIVANFDAGHDLHIIQLKEIEPVYPLIAGVPFNNPAAAPTSPDQVKVDLYSDKISPTVTKQPAPTSSFVPKQSIDRDGDLKRIIDGFQPRSTANLDHQQLTDQDMKIVVEQAIKAKRCEKLSLQSNRMKSQGIDTLFSGIRESTTLEELNLSNNYLSDNDLFPLVQALSVNRTTAVEQWKICGIARVKVNNDIK